MHTDLYLVGVPIGMAQPEAMLPVQYFGARRKQAPEQRLMMAVLRDAFDCVEKYRFAANDHGRRLFREAERWFLAKETHWPYSFESICSVLDLDANAVRMRLLRLGRSNKRGGALRQRDDASQGAWNHCKQARGASDVSPHAGGRAMQ